MTNAAYAKLTARLIAAWFVFALTAWALHLFRADPGRPPLQLGLAVAAPVALFLLWFGLSGRFREFTRSLSPRVLTLIQAWRVGGFVFLVLYTYHILPGLFALPAGWGDMAIGATAPLVAARLTRPQHRGAFILWQVLGMTDLVMAIVLGTTARYLNPGGIDTSPMSVLPLSLIPTFVVPLLLMFHIICIGQARRWRAEDVSVGQGATSSSVGACARLGSLVRSMPRAESATKRSESVRRLAGVTAGR